MRARERDPLLLLRVKRRRRRRHSVCQTQNAERRNIDGGFSEVLYSVGRARLTLPFVSLYRLPAHWDVQGEGVPQLACRNL